MLIASETATLLEHVDPEEVASWHQMASWQPGREAGSRRQLSPVDGAGEPGVWRVVFHGAVRVRSEPSPNAEALGTMQPGDLVRGHRQQDWLALADGGYLRIATKKAVLLEQGDPSDPAYRQARGPAGSEGDEMAEAQGSADSRGSGSLPAGLSEDDGAEIGTWEVVSHDPVAVRSSKSPQAQVLALIEPGERLTGSVQIVPSGSWLALMDEPGFMRIAVGDKVLLQRCEGSEEFAPRAQGSTEDYGRGRGPTEDYESGQGPTDEKYEPNSLSTQEEDSQAQRSMDQGGSYELQQSIATSQEASLEERMRAAHSSSMDQEPSLESIQPKAGLWRVVIQGGVYVRRTRDPASQQIGARREGEVVRGMKEGDWVALADEPGYVRIYNRQQILLERVTDPNDSVLSQMSDWDDSQEDRRMSEYDHAASQDREDTGQVVLRNAH